MKNERSEENLRLPGRADAWSDRADRMHRDLFACYMNEDTGILDQWYPRTANRAGDNFYYWWQAHVLDVLVDAYERTGDPALPERIGRFCRSLESYNSGTFTHNYYDDMEWTALALLRAYQGTGEPWYKEKTLELWEDIQTAWNGYFDGGMAWKKDQLDYKNTPANAPAAILAARLYRLFGREADLAWAKRIYDWNRSRLVDPATGFVWDGINRLGDGQIDKDWKFTYCQGVFIGAGVELHRCTGDPGYLKEAQRTAAACFDALCEPGTGLLPDEGIDDTGLFKGILIRYLVELLRADPDCPRVREIIMANAERLWSSGLLRPPGLCGPSWQEPPRLPVQLSVQLSGLMLLEAAAVLEATVNQA
ncbi:glycoside hydrolase family 76 protein [Paenibacillus macerans]|uniref:glycoside hydrolase family 76 protein n=1 Tax=Paenibacillus macerans TaxID=44252 RepID=UPI003D323FA2